MFEHSSLPLSIIKQDKNNWARNCMWHYYHFMLFQYKSLINLPTKLGENDQNSKKY